MTAHLKKGASPETVGKSFRQVLRSGSANGVPRHFSTPSHRRRCKGDATEGGPLQGPEIQW
jgi:hypothetical protein